MSILFITGNKKIVGCIHLIQKATLYPILF